MASGSAWAGPLVSFGQGYLDDYNTNIAPSIFVQGHGLMDSRIFYQYKGQSNAVSFWAASSQIMTVNITPATLAVGAVAAAAVVVSGTAMTLVSADGAGIVVGKSITNPLTGLTVSGLLAVGQVATPVSFGVTGTYKGWDPTTMTARALSITASNASGVGGAFVIRGYDVYGYPMSETLTSNPSGALTVTGKKAFKYIASVTPGFSDPTYTYSVNTTDIFGLPLASVYFGDTLMNYNATLITATTGYVAGVNTTATATTGDVRGTYNVQSASDGTKRLIIYQTPLLSNLQIPNGVGGTSTGLFGVSQFTA